MPAQTMAIALAALAASAAVEAPGVELTGWTYQWERGALAHPEGPEMIERAIDQGAWQALAEPIDPPGREGAEVLWLRVTLPNPRWSDPVVVVPKALVALQAYVDGRRVYSVSDLEVAGGLPVHTIAAPNGASHVLTLRVFSSFTKIGLPEGARAGNRAALLAERVRRDLSRVVVAALLALVAVGLLLLSVRSKDARAQRSIALFSGSLAGWTLFYAKTKELYLADPAIWFGVWVISVPAACLGFAMFVEAVFGAGPAQVYRWIRRVAAFFLVTALIVFAMHLDNRTIGVPAHVASRIFYLLGNCVYLGILVPSAFRGDREARILVAGLVPLALASIHDHLSSIGVASGLGPITHWAVAIFDLTLVGVLLLRVQRMRTALDATARERQHMLQDLHDGLGGITTNIRLLADMGRRSERDDREETLTTISSLASEGIGEIRALINSLEPSSLDWTVLRAELRRLAQLRLEPLELELRFEVEVDPRAPPPSSLLTLNLLRIYSEAITNVVKHSKARSILIRLEIERERVLLCVHDDGAGLAETGPGPGRGIANMRSRAQTLGGTFSIEEDSGTRVQASLPLPARSA